MVVYNAYLDLSYWDDKVTRELFHWSNTTLYVGITLYSYEGIACVFTIRNTLKKPKQMLNISIKAYTIIGIMFVILGISFYVTYGDEKGLESVFGY